MIIPCGTEINNILTSNQSFSKGNFSLWFNKFVPLNNNDYFAACDIRGDKDNTVKYYFDKYTEIRKNNSLSSALSQKHQNQKEFCNLHKDNNYAVLEIKAVLTSPLITGIGQTHPSEIGMVFDHTLGIPYIPASSVKGLVRFAHILDLIKNDSDNWEYINFEKKELDESHPKTKIPDLFGGDFTLKKNNHEEKLKVIKKRGQVIFLDAYSEGVPELHIDIMNPHYGDYYQDETGKTPPTDNMKLNPIKFLTVAKGTRFVFRAIIPLSSDLKETVKRNYVQALTVEGVGAKTAVGYGRFNVLESFNNIEVKELDTTESTMLKITQLQNWDEIKQFCGRELPRLKKKISPSKIKTAIIKQIETKAISKKKLKQNPNLLQDRIDEIKEILGEENHNK